MIAGRIAGPAAALDVLKKPRAEAPGNARQFGLRLHHEYFGRYMIFGFLALLQGTLVCWAICSISACSVSIRFSS